MIFRIFSNLNDSVILCSEPNRAPGVLSTCPTCHKKRSNTSTCNTRGGRVNLQGAPGVLASLGAQKCKNRQEPR